MNAPECHAALRMIAASWPTPQMTDDEAQRWVARFVAVGFDECAVALVELEQTTRWRPTWAEVYEIIKANRRRAADDAAAAQRALSAPNGTYREIGKRHVRQLKQMLEEGAP